jgi:SAM-dependent methyltransferase
MTGNPKISEENANSWGLSGVIDYFQDNRRTTDHVYPSEWFFLKDCLTEGVSVLDVGCAQGGFAGVIGENVSSFTYTGLDINGTMIDIARDRYPDHMFYHVAEGDYSVLGNGTFDLVLVLGILHLHETWRDTMALGWRHTKGDLIFDLREGAGPSVEDKSVSYFKMDFGVQDQEHEARTLPYIIVNASEALETVTAICENAGRLQRYGYTQSPSPSAVTPVSTVMAEVYKVSR